MRATGFEPARARDHDNLVVGLCGLLTARGYEPEQLAPDGDGPDLRIRDRDGRVAYVDVKVPKPGQHGYAIKLGALAEFRRLTLHGTPVYIVWLVEGRRPTVDTVDTLTARIQGGPRRSSGRGSNTDWLLVRPGGTDLAEFFPDINDKAAVIGTLERLDA